jgi:5-methylthioadenosine/S-adenosylhomocysteine deaminase
LACFLTLSSKPRPRREAKEPGRDAPLNHASGAVVTLMERSNVSTVLCADQIKKWRGGIIGYDIPKLRAELDASRDYVFAAAGIERDLFRA